jgi:Phage portal protein, lambda family
MKSLRSWLSPRTWFNAAPRTTAYNEIPRDQFRLLIKHPWARKLLMQTSIEQDLEGSHYHGMLNILSNDSVGPCPIIIGQSDLPAVNVNIEDAWIRFCQMNEIGNAIRLMRRAAARSGVAIAIPFKKEGKDKVQLGLRVIPTEKLANPPGANINDRIYEGIEYNKNYEPIKIYLDTGESYSTIPTKGKPPEALIWWKKKDECRIAGVPECSPALCILPSVKRYLDCLIRSAEFKSAIPMAIVLDPLVWGKEAAAQTGMPSGTFEYEPGMIPTLPPGAKLEGLPISNSAEDHAALDAMIGCAARCINMPLNLATGNSSKHNMASSQVDFGPWKNFIMIDREDFCPVTHAVYNMWSQAGRLIPGYFSQITNKYIEEGFSYALSYSSVFSHPDPLKISNSNMTDLISGTTTLVRIYTEQGKNPRRELEREALLLGITYEQLVACLLANRNPSALQVLKIESDSSNTERNNG